MDIIRGLENWVSREPAGSVALGFFDGVHRGHQQIIATSVQAAKERGLKSVVLTFEPHPLAVLEPEAAPPLLTPFAEKARLIRQLGVDTLLVLPFTPALAALEAALFAREVLAGRLAARHVTVGYNYSFGRGGEGTPAALAAWGRQLGFAVTVVPPVLVAGEAVSSSALRLLIARGDMEKATSFLGRPPAISGRVVTGARRGRGLGFPTANVELKKELVLPRRGVYAVRTWYRRRSFPGVANIGQVPTFGGSRLQLEVHFFDFHGNLYGKRLRVEFISFLRPERTFPSAAELKAQIEADARCARELLSRLAAGKSSPALVYNDGGL